MSELNQNNSEEIDFQEIFDAIWNAKIRIAILTSIFAIFSVFYALSIPNQYKSSALLIPAQQEGGTVSNSLGQIGDLASLAGVNLGNDKNNEAKIAEEIMKSWAFIESFIEENNLAVEIMAAEGWDKESNKLLLNNDIYDAQNKKWISKPTSWKLFQSFSDRVEVKSDKSSVLMVSVEYYSPQIAKKWLDLYISAINKHMQSREIKKVNRNIEYLEEQVLDTSISKMRDIFYGIIGEQIKNKMLAEASPEYVFIPISPSMISEEKSKPMRSRICITITLLGGILSVLFFLGLYYFRKYSESNN